VFVFAALSQLVGCLFGVAVRTSFVPRVIIFTKITDLVTPFGIYLCTHTFSLNEYAFSVLTVAMCIPVFFEAFRSPQKRDTVLYVISAALVIQGSISVRLLPHAGVPLSDWIEFTAGVLAWRLALSVLFAMGESNRSILQSLGGIARMDSALLLARASLALVTQLTFNVALGSGHPIIAWPLLNCTAPVALVLSSVLLKEHPTTAEVASAVGIVLVAVIKAVI
jgi:hypothetical protein